MDILRWLFGLARDEIILRLLIYFLTPVGMLMYKHILGQTKELKKLRRVSFLAFWFIVAMLSVSVVVSGARMLTAEMVSGQRANVIGSVRQFGFNNTKDGSTEIICHLRLANTGLPTTLWSWEITAITPDGQLFTTPAQDLASLRFEKGSMHEAMYNDENYLPWVMIERAVSRESGASGWAMFKFDKIQRSEIERIGTEFKIQFTQTSDGEKRVISHVWAGRGM